MESENNGNANDDVFTDGVVSVESPKSQSRLPRLFQRQCYPPHFIHKVVAEVIATYLLVFVTAGSAAISVSDAHKVSQLGASIAGGLIVTVMIYAVGHISGAHMNPAVTFAFAAVRHFPWRKVPFYAAAQLTGATSAAFTLRVILHPVRRIGTTTPSGNYVQALITEIVVTFSMMFVTSAVATDTKAIGELAGIAVGSAVCITSILAGPISGGSMNPARTIGPAIASNDYKGIWIYVVGPVCGTVLGALSYSFIRLTDKSAHAIQPHHLPSFKMRIRTRNNNVEQKATDAEDPLDAL